MGFGVGVAVGAGAGGEGSSAVLAGVALGKSSLKGGEEIC